MADRTVTVDAGELRALIRDAVAEALAQQQPLSARVYPADAKTDKRTIRHHLFDFDLPGGGHKIAFRGETVDLLPHDVERGERFGAFTANVGDEPDAPTNSTLAPFKPGASDEDMDGWIMSGSVSEIMAAVNADPASASLVLEAERRRGEDARKTLLEALARLAGER